VPDITFDVPENQALQLRKDDRVTFSGTIDSVTNILGSCQIRLSDATVE
jgi:hypothetical protein